MTPEKILEIAHRYSDKAYPAPDDDSSRVTYWEFLDQDLIAFAQSVIEAEQGSSDEPVAWLTEDGSIFRSHEIAAIRQANGPYPLYRHPSPARKLTDEARELFAAIERRANGEQKT